MVILSLILWFTKHSKIFILFQSSTSRCLLLVHSNEISVAQSRLPIYEIHISFMTTEWKVSSLLPRGSQNFTTVNRYLSASDVSNWETSSPKYCTASVISSSMFIDILLLLNYLIFVPKKLFTLPFVTVLLQMWYLIIIYIPVNGAPFPLMSLLAPHMSYIFSWTPCS